jgi:hypothetical protein
MERGSSFEDLRRLATCFDRHDARGARKAILRLGGTALPLLLRELGSSQPARAQLACGLIAELAAGDAELRGRAVRALQALAASARSATRDDDIKARALSLLGELGVAAASAVFSDPEAVQRRSAAALAEQLGSDADVAAAADLMARRLDPEEMVSLLEIMTETTPEPAARLIHELSGRTDLEGSVRSDVRRLGAASRAATWTPPAEPASAGRRRSRARPSASEERRPHGGSAAPAAGATAASASGPTALRPTRLPGTVSALILDDGRGSQVVVAVRRRGSQRRWRRFAVLIGADGALEDCLYEDDVPASELGDPRNAPLVCGLLAEGYRLLGDDPARGRALAAAAARLAATIPHRLTSAYYLGRDILELGDVHLGPRDSLGELATAIGRAVDLLAAGDVARARELALLCARVAPDNPDVSSTLGQCYLATGELTAAAEWLGRAAAAEPAWPMHHWNLAAVHHAAGCPAACADALAAYLAAVERQPLSDRGDDERVTVARRYIAAHRPARAEPASAPRRSRRLPRDAARKHRARED